MYPHPRDFVLAVLLVCSTVQMSRAKSEWNQETRDLIVKIHNDRRRNEGGCQINKLVYDDELERQAKQWAESCVYKHGTADRGENLAYSTKKLSENELIKWASDAWFDEKNKYSYGQYSCSNGPACHYTQMVWGTTNRIGCYSTVCNYLSGGVANSWYLVCFYTPKGNWNGEKPYERSCPSPCLPGQSEEDGLCVGEATKAPEECKDEVSDCKLWASNGECQRNQKYMSKSCRKSCKICESEGEEECVDIEQNCPIWAQNNQCQGNPTFMDYNCKKSCGKC